MAPQDASAVAPTVFVVDDDASVRASLSRLLASHGYRVEAFASAGDYLGREAPCGPSCIVLDVQMPGLSGLDLQKELAKRRLDSSIVFVTGHATVPMGIQAMKTGAVDFLQKPYDLDELLAAVDRAVRRDARHRQAQMELSTIEARCRRLTRREREVLALVAEGLLNKQVAGRLGVAESTIKVHRGRIMRKMEANSLADLVRMADLLGRQLARPR